MDAAGDGAGGDAGAPDALGWSSIPDLQLTVGVPVDVNLRSYLTDPGGAASITLDGPLVDGLSLDASSIVGTPTTEMTGGPYVATADDGDSRVVSEPFTIEVTAASIDIELERATPEQIGIYIPLSPAPSEETTAAVRYRPSGTTSWNEGHPLLRIHPEWNSSGAPVPPVDAFAGVIFDLTPATAYDVEVTLTPPGGEAQTTQTVVSTRALPGASPPPTVEATPSDDLQALLDGLAPGDVLELGAGTYDASGLQLQVAGTAEAPIVIRGADRDSVVLRANRRVLQVLRASHVVIEDLTMEGSGSDSGTDASSIGVSFWNGAEAEFITFRRLTIRGVDKGIIASGPVRSILVYDCTLDGNNEWNAEFVESNLTWNDDGLRLPGEGNCAFNNTLHGFGDSFAVKGGVFSAGIYFYRNRITMTGDDSFEGDYGTRNLAFYDNHISNAGTLLSLDPLWGGPLYCFRNVAINTVRGPFKLNSEQSGFMIYNNTIVRTDGTTSWGWVQYRNGDLRNFSFRNNLLVYHGSGSLLALESEGIEPVDFTHNGFFPDGSVWWTNSGGSYGSLDEAFSGLPATQPLFGTSTQRHEHDRIVEGEPFEDSVPLGADHSTEVSSLYVPALDASSVARNAGTEIPNITDDYSGSAPDMGAVISGRPTPSWGAR